jgi:hypothetical protein
LPEHNLIINQKKPHEISSGYKMSLSHSIRAHRPEERLLVYSNYPISQPTIDFQAILMTDRLEAVQTQSVSGPNRPGLTHRISKKPQITERAESN